MHMNTESGRVTGKIALITGAGGGFGEGIAKLFAAHGAKVGVLDLRGEAAEKVAGEIGENAVALAADVTSAPQMQAAVDKLCATFGVPDILVNNAG